MAIKPKELRREAAARMNGTPVRVDGMFETRHGEGATATGPLGVTEEHIDRAKDLAMLGMSRRKVPYRLIARYFNCSIGTVHNRLKSIPPEAARYYARTLVGVGDSFGPG